MDTLTTELRQAVLRAGDSPLRLVDPETHGAYALVSTESFERLLLKDENRREQAAFLRAAKKNAMARTPRQRLTRRVRSSKVTELF